MIDLQISEVCAATNGTLLKDSEKVTRASSFKISGVSTDTRQLKESDLFIALKGPSFDAHTLLETAIMNGASALLVEKGRAVNVPDNVAVIEVNDTKIALGLLSSFIRNKVVGLKCAAITGSNGKTTCKELLSAILCIHTGHENTVLATAGNFNNDIGLPLTLLRLEAQHQFAVVELGANHKGEIAYTSALAKPDIALVNNVMPAHLEGFGSLQGIADTKAEIWTHLTPSGVAVVNLDADFAAAYIQQLKQNNQPFLGFSIIEQNPYCEPDVFASNVTFDDAGRGMFTLNIKQPNKLFTDNTPSIRVQLTLPGKHNVHNALAASTMAIALGCSLIEIKAGLAALQAVNGRVHRTELSPLLSVIDDTYNANSASVKAGIDLLTQYAAKRVLICGDMGELGEYAQQEHQGVGEYAAQQEIDKLFTVGDLSRLTTNAYNAASKGTAAEHFIDKKSLKLAIQAYLNAQDSKMVVLVKGSRSAKMEEIVFFIKNDIGAQADSSAVKQLLIK